jgi:hypothetical protein
VGSMGFSSVAAHYPGRKDCGLEGSIGRGCCSFRSLFAAWTSAAAVGLLVVTVVLFVPCLPLGLRQQLCSSVACGSVGLLIVGSMGFSSVAAHYPGREE